MKFEKTASRSLHLHQPRAWLRHTPYLQTAQTLKPTCMVCAVCTRSLREAASRSLHPHQPRAWLRHTTLPAGGTNFKTDV